MARARNIKPAFFSNEELAELPFEARLLFIGLWTLADREGRLEDRPKRIKMAVFPADNIDVEPSLSGLERFGLITRYTFDGIAVIQIINFIKHQRPHGAEKDSDLPCSSGLYIVHKRGRNGLVIDCEKFASYTKQQLTENKNSFSTVSEPIKNLQAPFQHALNPDSLNPDSLNPESNTEEEKKVEKKESPQAAGAAPPDFLPKHSALIQPTPRPEPAKPKPQAVAKPDGVADAVWLDWLALRKAKKAAVTATVLAQAESEAAKASMSLNDFFAEWCLRGSQGLKAEWLLGDRGRQGFAKPNGGTVNGVGVSATTIANVQAAQEYMRKKGKVFHAEIGSLPSGETAKRNDEVIDV